MPKTDPPITDRLRQFAEMFDRRFSNLLTPAGHVPQDLVAAVRYASLAPGKRLRPYLVLRCCELVGGRTEEAWPVAAAVECVHAFSLIHDDLPAMDDDAFRRGQPTCHKEFGEATAILAGDALAVLAFEILAREIDDPHLAVRLVRELARATGWEGMIGGQASDVRGAVEPANEVRVTYIHERKTARLFEACCRMGALSGNGGTDEVAALGRYGNALGRAFQIADDLLDVTSDAATLGKGVQKDAAAEKQTFPGCVGIEQSRAAAAAFVRDAVTALEFFGKPAEDLRVLAEYAVSRNY